MKEVTTPKLAPDKDGEKKDPPKVISYWSLYNCDGADYVAILLGVVGAGVNAVTMPLFSLIFGEMIDALQPPIDNDKVDREVAKLALWFVYLAIAALFASFFEVAMFMWSGTRQVARLRQKYLEASLNQEIAYYDTQATSGDVLSGLNADCHAVQAAISEKVGNAIHHTGTFVVAIIIALIRGWELTLIMLCLMPLIAIAGGILAKISTAGTEKISEAYAKANVASSQAISNIRTVASFQAEEGLFDKYKALLDAPRKLQIRMSGMTGLAGGFVNGIIFWTYAIAFLYAAKLVREPNTDYTPGRVMNVIFSIIIGGFSLGQAAPNFSTFAVGRAAGWRIHNVINRQPLIDVSAEGKVPNAALEGNLSLTDVSFSYPARADVSVFRSLSLSVSAGQTVALVGASGSGKSTVIQLLQRFYDPHSGTVSVDGMDIRSLSLAWYRNQVGLVAQEPTLFATSIRANIAMGKEGATEQQIQDAAKAANAHKFVSKLPEGYSTQVGERGVQLSGGQKQRIAIARALLKNPRILLLDEATSALDTVSERLVQAALETLAEGRTTVIVAHRLSTIRKADKISVVKDGSIVEEGPHAELYAKPDSVYHSLVKLQEQAMDKRAEADAEVGEQDEVPAEDQELIAAAMASEKNMSSRKSQERKSQERLTTSYRDALPDKKGSEKEGELTEEEKAVKVGMLRLLRMNSKEWPLLATGILASGAIGMTMPLFALFLSDIIGSLDPNKPRWESTRMSIAFFGLGTGTLLMAAIQSSSFAVVGANLAERVRLLFFKAVLYMEVAWFDRDDNSSGALTSRLSTDAPTVRGATGDVLGLVVQNLVTLFAGYTIAFIFGWRMALVITASLPLLGFSSYMQMKFFTGMGTSNDRLYSQANQTAHEGIMALRTVHSYNMQSTVANLYRSMLSEPNKKANQTALSSGAAFGTAQAIQFLVYALGFWFGGEEVQKGRMDIVDMLKVFFAIILASMGMSQAQMSFPDVAKASKAVARIFRVVDRVPLIDASKEGGVKPAETVNGEVQLMNVNFSYPTRPDVPIFRNFSLLAPAAAVTALVGESGSGKSTIVNLVERFYDVDQGQVLLDGRDIRLLNLKWLRSKVGLVGQEPALFNGTVLENIRLGKPDATMDEVNEACEIANASEFIKRQPDQFGTLLGEGGGISLSGGQKQRIAIARAVLKDPRVLLLDEATSALDSESERVVQDALDKLMKGRTSIVIAHRLTTIRNADKIAVVQAGVVLEEGSHDELMQRGAGAYVQLARAQAGSS